MLGKLFNLTSGNSGNAAPHHASASAKQSPESVQEEIHTRSLLFPDTQALYYRQDQVFPLPTATSPSSSNLASKEFDYDDELELEFRDVRVIIMQDSLGSVNPSLLFDSHPGPVVPAGSDRPSTATIPPQTLVQDLRRNPTSPRKTSLGPSSRPVIIQPESPQPRQGAFDRRSSIHTRNYSYVETEAQRAAREYREEIASFSSCIFANSEVMSYKGTSTKVHIIPSEARASDASSSFVGDGRGSMGRSTMRSSRLAQSFTNPAAGAPNIANTATKQVEHRKILVTRLFPVNLPTEDPETPNTSATPQRRLSEDAGGFPFPASPDESGMRRKKLQPKQKRTPMYAVALVLRLPSSQPNPTTTAPKPVFRGPSSYTEQESFPSSFNSTRRAGWTMVGSGFGPELSESFYSNEVEDGMDTVTQHWDIVMRTLTHLQSVVATTLFPMLKQMDFASPDPLVAPVSAQVSRSQSINSRRSSNASQIKPPKTNAKLVTLAPNCLMQDQQIEGEVETARIRIVSGLRATRVVTGQGRWGPWREEARWVAKWAGGKEQGFFFFNLLTGFLAIHTDWLQALSPVWYRKHYYQQQKGKSEEDTSLPSRTIIVSKNKIAARRLVFLLSAFLPANQQLPTVRTHRPSTSASFSHSPPSYIVPIVREESLRRKMNRRPVGQRGPSHARSFSIQSQGTTRSATGIPAQLAHLSMDNQHGRRSSDATFFKSPNLPVQGSDLSTRKSSAATSNTITPDAVIPHFTTVHRSNTRRSQRPGSSGSMAADDLRRTLTRGDSVGHASISSTHSRTRSSHWGSVISGLWSTRRRESTTITTHTFDPSGPHGSPPTSPTQLSPRKGKHFTLGSGAQPRDGTPRNQDESFDTSKGREDQRETPRIMEGRSRGDFADPSSRMADPSSAFESPVKTSINADDGVIDVDVQFPDYLTSFESAISSPSSSGYLSTPGFGNGLDGFEQLTRIAIDGDAPLNAAGWLQQFHPDFSLQAIPPDADLMNKVRASLMAEPTPAVHQQSPSVDWPTERWVDVSSAIIADTTNFTIKRLRYRRLIKPKVSADRNSGHFLSSSSNPYSSALMTPALSPYEQPINERIEEETLVTLDEALIEAVEKVIAHSNDASKGSSANSSRSASKRRDRSDSELSEPDEHLHTTRHKDTHEVPRAECKTVVLTALGEIVQNVVEQREREGRVPSPGVTYEAREKESALREAVRDWLAEVELRDL